MRITTLAEYGVICVLHLARREGEGPITGREIAEAERLPGDYVEGWRVGLSDTADATAGRALPVRHR